MLHEFAVGEIATDKNRNTDKKRDHFNLFLPLTLGEPFRTLPEEILQNGKNHEN
jgi:hypothetical protein